MKVLRLAVLMVLVLGVAGCGSGDDVAEAPSASSAPSAAASAPSALSAPSAAASAAGGGGVKVLTATVGEQGKPDAFTLTIEDASGAAVTTLPAGEYQIRVSDPSTIHNVHLTGPGVDETTSVPEIADVTWTVQLTAGTYLAVCDPHQNAMKVDITVT